ncbi:triple tyrosine motif-containing protein [Clostridium carnis]
MGEIFIDFDKQSPALIEDEINIKLISNEDEFEKFKFLQGCDGKWKPIQDFSFSKECKWRPDGVGKYLIMVQGKKKGSTKPFDFVERAIYEIKAIDGEDLEKETNNDKKIIEDVFLDKTSLKLGEKIKIEVKSKRKLVLYRFWIKGKQGWEPLRDYNGENFITFTGANPGEQEILIECKMPNSEENVDDFTTVRFKVKENTPIEINSFECLNEELLVNEELLFKVGSNCDENRTLLYKFLRVDKNGRINCLQDYSTRKIVRFSEKEKGDYKLLCLVRDIFSNKEYDDRAIMLYNVKPYTDIKIKKFSSDANSPQMAGNNIVFKSVVDGGKELLYRYIIEGPIAEDTGYIRSNVFQWETIKEGEYKVTLQVRDISYKEEYEDKKTVLFNIDKKGEKPIKITDVIATKTRNCIVGEPINIKVKAEGGTSLKYSFLVYKDGKEKERSGYGGTNWVNFTPEENGEYEVEVRVLDKYSSKEYDSHEFIYFKVKEYPDAEIDYVLLDSKETYLVGDVIELESIVQNTKSILLRYVTKINGHEIEDTDYITSRRLRVKPKCPGKYTFEIYAKNIKCKEGYDCKKEISVYVHEALPVRETKIKIVDNKIEEGKEITFEVSSIGGKEVCYEFYIMEKGNWVRVQEYSRKNYYTFLPFSKGKYRVLVLSKSYYKKNNYEDYDNIEFEVTS